MSRLTVDDYEFVFPKALELYKFDEQDSANPHFHGLSHCMKAVDAIVELPKTYLFIEIKRFDKRSALNKDNNGCKEEALDDLINRLCGKYRDTFLYRFCQGKVDKPIKYICLIDKFDKNLFLRLRNKLLKKIPAGKQLQAKWGKELLAEEDLFVLSEQTWNRSKMSGLGSCKYVGK